MVGLFTNKPCTTTQRRFLLERLSHFGSQARGKKYDGFIAAFAELTGASTAELKMEIADCWLRHAADIQSAGAAAAACHSSGPVLDVVGGVA